MEVSDEEEKQKHFVLVHGACHGAWTWYKIKPLLEAAGHRLTVLDMAASGVNMKAIEDVHTAHEYSEPLLEFMSSLPQNEKIVLVGHSLGGINVAIATEKFPKKISVVVFLTAFMPDTVHKPSYVVDQLVERTPASVWLDTQFTSLGDCDQPRTSMFFGVNCLSSKLYQLSPCEDLELAKMLIRPGSLFREDLSNTYKFSEEAYESVTRVFIMCKEDRVIPEEFQLWMIENSGAEEIFEIKDADHMPMFSNPQGLCDCLLKIADNYG